VTGLFGGSLLTPAQRQKNIIRKALELRVQFWAHGDNFVYRGAGDLLLRHGRFYSGRELPDQYKPLTGEMGRCFFNALEATTTDPHLHYCEGVYTTGSGHYTAHAWCLDPDGELLELTYPTEPERIAGAIDFTTRQPVLSPKHWGYWGAVFHPDYVRAVMAAQDNMPVLDRPIHDALFDKAGLDSEEPRTDWPIYHYPYNPNRRTL
jgi:hypothetical protein